MIVCSSLMVEYGNNKTLLYPLNSNLFPVYFPIVMPAVIMCICIIILLLLCCWPCYRLMLSFNENVHACCFLNPSDLPRISPWTVYVFLFKAIWGWCLVARQIGPLGWDWFSHDVGHINKPVPVPCYYVFCLNFVWCWWTMEWNWYMLLLFNLVLPGNLLCLCLVCC